MKKSIMFFTVIAIITVAVTNAFPKDKVAIMPFKVKTTKALPYKIHFLIKEKLKKQNFETSILNWEYIPEELSSVRTKQFIFKKFNLDCLIYGNLTENSTSFVFEINVLTMDDSNKTTQSIKKNVDITSFVKTINNAIDKSIINQLKQKTISEIHTKGNVRIKKDAILEVMENKIGKIFSKTKTEKDIKNIYKLGCFEDITIAHKYSPVGLIILVEMQESPIVKKIQFVGIDKLNQKKLQDNINICKGDFFKSYQLQNSIEQIKQMYQEINYHNANINCHVNKLKDNKVELKFVIEEGKKLFVNKIKFTGNNSFNHKTLKKVIKSSEKNRFSWLTGSGKLKNYFLLHDENELLKFYRSNGFINVKIGQALIQTQNHFCTVTFKIEEGHRYKMGNFHLEGDLLLKKEKDEIIQILKAPQCKWFDTSVIQDDIFSIAKIYMNEGFINAEILPKIEEISDNTLNLTYIIKKNTKVTIKNIEITGNTITHDNVIRRELEIHEGELFNKNKVEISLHKLRRLELFGNIEAQQTKLENSEKINLNFKVKEKPTGQISFGAGYSSTDKFFVTGLISQSNLFGKGQSIKVSGTIGSNIDHYNLSFNEPWLFDIPLSGTIRFYKDVDERNSIPNENKTNKYKQIDTGLYLGATYPLSNFVSTSINYNYNVSEDMSEESEVSKNLTKKYNTSSITFITRYDSRDRTFYTKNGSKHRIACTYAGLGGNLSFIKLETTVGFYIPLNKKFTLSLRSSYGYIRDLATDNNRYECLRDTDRFHLGGMNSIRAYDYNSINGGNQYVLFNSELTYPIYEEMNLLGVIFYDAGEVFEHNLNTLKNGIGCGIRWFSPLGPIRLEVARKLNRKDHDDKIKWNFAIGVPF